jgi:hypothetical protein
MQILLRESRDKTTNRAGMVGDQQLISLFQLIRYQTIKLKLQLQVAAEGAPLSHALVSALGTLLTPGSQTRLRTSRRPGHESELASPIGEKASR